LARLTPGIVPLKAEFLIAPLKAEFLIVSLKAEFSATGGAEQESRTTMPDKMRIYAPAGQKRPGYGYCMVNASGCKPAKKGSVSAYIDRNLKNFATGFIPKKIPPELKIPGVIPIRTAEG
jgi:hypothetical protein